MAQVCRRGAESILVSFVLFILFVIICRVEGDCCSGWRGTHGPCTAGNSQHILCHVQLQGRSHGTGLAAVSCACVDGHSSTEQHLLHTAAQLDTKCGQFSSAEHWSVRGCTQSTQTGTTSAYI